MRREAQLKRWSRAKKEVLIKGDLVLLKSCRIKLENISDRPAQL